MDKWWGELCRNDKKKFKTKSNFLWSVSFFIVVFMDLSRFFNARTAGCVSLPRWCPGGPEWVTFRRVAAEKSLRA